jgi:hypothetical protein
MSLLDIAAVLDVLAAPAGIHLDFRLRREAQDWNIAGAGMTSPFALDRAAKDQRG